jgi:hypothetical protein
MLPCSSGLVCLLSRLYVRIGLPMHGDREVQSGLYVRRKDGH